MINKSNPRWRGAHKTQIQTSCKGTGSRAHMSSVCLASGASAWSHGASGDSPVGSPHTPEGMPLNRVLECSFSLLSLAFLHSALFFFFPHGSSWLFDGLNYLVQLLTRSNLIFATQFRLCKHPVPHRQATSQSKYANLCQMLLM